MPLTIPVVALLSQWTGGGGCGWPSSSKVSRQIRPSLMFKKNAPDSASDADAAAKGRMLHSAWNAPLRKIGLLSFGSAPRKKCPAALLRAFLTERYDASE